MAAVLTAASYSRIGFSLYFAVLAQHVRVLGGNKFYQIHPFWNLTVT